MQIQKLEITIRGGEPGDNFIRVDVEDRDGNLLGEATAPVVEGVIFDATAAAMRAAIEQVLASGDVVSVPPFAYEVGERVMLLEHPLVVQGAGEHGVITSRRRETPTGTPMYAVKIDGATAPVEFSEICLMHEPAPVPGPSS